MASLALVPFAPEAIAAGPAPTMKVTRGLSGPGQAAFDSHGNLWVADNLNSEVLKFAPPYTGSPSVVASLSQAWNIAFDSHGNPWGSIEGVTVVPLVAGFKTVAISAAAFTFDSSGNLWVADSVQIYEFSASSLPGSGSLTTADAALTLSDPSVAGTSGLAFDTSGNLWASECSAGVGEIAAPISGSSTWAPRATETNAKGASFGCAYGIAFDHSGNLWVGDYSGRAAYEFASPYSGPPVRSLTAVDSSGSRLNQPFFVAFDGSGNLWVSDYSRGAVYEYSASSISALPSGPIPVPPAIPPAHLPTVFHFRTIGGTPETGTLVKTLTPGAAVYNVPGIDQSTVFGQLAAGDLSMYPAPIAYCSTTANGADVINVTGFYTVWFGAPPLNSTEMVFSWFHSYLTPAAGWPAEPACGS